MNSIYPIAIQRSDKTETTLGEFQGQVLLIVNVASKCGLTPQYDGLERIHEKFASRGFSVLGFPANEFGAQESGTNEQIQEFCRLNFGVKFPVFAKIVVKGPGQHPLYNYLTHQFPKASVKGSTVLKLLRKIIHSDSFTGEVGEIGWNFEKFLVSRDGEVVARFPPDTTPEDPWITEAIESLLTDQP
jgi:glutathione peroxidase